MRPAALLAPLLALALVSAACGDDDEAGTDTTVPTTTAPATTTAPPATTEPPASTTVPATTTTADPDAPVTVTTGLVEAWAPGSEVLVVADFGPEGVQEGCEGQPEPVLYRVEVASGERTTAVSGDPSLNGILLLDEAGDGALIDGCEGFVSEVYPVQLAEDGVLTVQEPLPAPEEGWPFGFVVVDRPVDGTVLASIEQFGEGEPPGRVVEVDLATGELTVLVALDEIAYGPVRLADGSIAVQAGGGVTVLGPDGAAIATYDASTFAVSDDRERLALFGDAVDVVDVASLAAGGGPTTLAPLSGPQSVFQATWAGDTLVWIEIEDVETQFVRAAGPDGTVTELAGPGQYARLAASPDGAWVATSELDPSDIADLGTVVLLPVPG